MGWGQIFCLPDEVRQHVVAALQHIELYTDKIKDVGASTEGPVQCASSNTAVTFTDDDLLLGPKSQAHYHGWRIIRQHHAQVYNERCRHHSARTV